MAVTDNQILMRLSDGISRPFHSTLSTPNLNLFNEWCVKLKDLVEKYKAKKELILADRNKSPEGKSTALGELATKALSEFAWMGRLASSWAETRDTRHTKLIGIEMPPTMDKEDARENRREYESLSQQERDMTFLRIAELSTVDDPEDPESQVRHTEELFSILGKRGRSLVTTEIRDRGLSERGRRLYPQVYEEFQQAQTLADEIGGLRDHVVLWLRSLGADPVKVHDQLGGPAPDLTEMHATVVHQG